MTAVTHDITIEQGATFTLDLLYKDNLGAPINLTGFTARMQVRRRYNDPVKLLDFTTENGAIVLGGAAGTIKVTGLATLTDDVPAKPGVYDLELVNGSVVIRLVEGSVEIKPEVTRV
jgi:hypothetical protein